MIRDPLEKYTIHTQHAHQRRSTEHSAERVDNTATVRTAAHIAGATWSVQRPPRVVDGRSISPAEDGPDVRFRPMTASLGCPIMLSSATGEGCPVPPDAGTRNGRGRRR